MKKSTPLLTGLLLLLSFASFFYRELIVLTQYISFILLIAIILRLTEWKYFQPIAIQDDYVLIPHRKRSLYYSSIEIIQFNANEMSLDIATEKGKSYTLESIHRQDFLRLVHAARNANPAIYVEDSLPLDEVSYQKLIDVYQAQKEAHSQNEKRYDFLFMTVITLAFISTIIISII